MSAVLTDAEALKKLKSLSEDIDQLSAVAKDLTRSDVLPLDPAVHSCLSLSWFFLEAALRESGYSMCGHVAITKGCQCCTHFGELWALAERIRRML